MIWNVLLVDVVRPPPPALNTGCPRHHDRTGAGIDVREDSSMMAFGEGVAAMRRTCFAPVPGLDGSAESGTRHPPRPLRIPVACLPRGGAAIVALVAAVAAHAGPPVRVNSLVEVRAGAHDRRDVPVVCVLDVPEADLDRVAIAEVDRPDVAVTCQVDRDARPRLSWIVAGLTPAGGVRRFRIERMRAPRAAAPNGVETRPVAGGIEVTCGGRPVLRYNSAHADPPDGIDPRNGRSGFIEPVWTPAGRVVTDRFPADHPHQSGVFLALTKTEFEGRKLNFWDLVGGGGRVRFARLAATGGGPVRGGLTVEHEHVAGDGAAARPVLRETWTVTVWNIGGPAPRAWVWDLESSLVCATASPLAVEQYHYGGLAIRGARAWGLDAGRFHTAAGLDRVAGNHSRPRWCDMSGPAGDGTAAGIAVLGHAANFRFPEPLRIHPTMPYMVFTPAHLGPWRIEPERPHVSRYRFVAHDGEAVPADLDRLWRDFAVPPEVVVVAGTGGGH
jgi:hypothetical protein